MEILFLIIVLVVLAMAVFSSRKEQALEADDRKDQVRQQKEDYAQEDVMTYGQVQQRREDYSTFSMKTWERNQINETKSKK